MSTHRSGPALEKRKERRAYDKQIVASAKKRLMKELLVTEEIAHRFIQQTAMDDRITMAQVASRLLSLKSLVVNS